MTTTIPIRGQDGTPKIVVGRFAPSPTGRLHLGHAYSAILAHDFARERGGSFLLRIEDIDPGRCREEFVQGIFEDLEWLGLSWDGDVIRQSARLQLYAEALDVLKARNLVYPCFCTRSAIAAEIAASAAAPHGPDGPLYPGTCRDLSDDERKLRMDSEAHAWRLDMAKALSVLPELASGSGAAERGGGGASAEPPLLTWTDHGQIMAATPELFGDVVLARKDAPTSYHLAVTVDDAAQGITDVIRGEDLLPSTHVHRLLQALLGLPTPNYHHHALLTDGDGRRLAKRHGSPSLADLRAAGADPRELADNLNQGLLPGAIRAAST